MKPLFMMIALIIFSFSLHAEQVLVGLDEVAITTGISKKDYTLGMTLLLNEFLKKENIETVVTSYDDPVRLTDDFKSGKVNMIASNAINVIKYLPISSLNSGITGYKYNKTDNQTLLVLTRSDNVRPLNEIIKGVIATDGDKVADLYFRTLMLQNKAAESPNYLMMKNNQQSILKLYFKQADIALVDRGSFLVAAELNPSLNRELKILKSVPLTLGTVCYIRKDMSSPLHAKVILMAKKINMTPRGKQLMQMFHADKMDESSVSELDSVSALMHQYNELIQHKPNPTLGKKR
ncbi:MAG: hypothetical protein PHQ90_03900 [Sulfuricurvum sp.]|uniref:PhnD/SsuA/transferrin family substrate-binding protein n=1 Tax=Sulfuricurvum sp. TaxID=2025608 RepID=UPI002609FBA9|nr:PhnD/SsuA/transferrin family substrate-binding protein [Sulfuricurvum sp.]MDD2368421.1 hypothetical protein [Sulfuricurvum sp.]MDD2950663.1 hypothetical protein [Sulfuricurvum sp.]MDD5119147.1 hypothetical protein [Sulfuricurvum sp.]